MPCNREVLFETDAFDQTWIHEAADGTHLYDIPISDLIYHLYSTYDYYLIVYIHMLD